MRSLNGPAPFERYFASPSIKEERKKKQAHIYHPLALAGLSPRVFTQ